MGVSGLLPLLKSIQRPIELKKCSGETLGVDAYGWLHRGAIACALELAQGKPTRKYVDFAMHRVRMLRHFGVTPYLVFDGDFLPSKAMTEGSRAKRREDSKKLGNELLKAGKPAQAYNEFQKAVDVTPEMARNLIDELKQLQVPYVVAPYEADSQLVYLERQGLINGIISEDSDLLVFGCKRLLTKLDQYGNCVEVNRRDFCAVREVSLTGWTDADFRRMAILSGCDYLAGVSNMGLKTAYRMIRKHKTPERLIRMLQFEGKHRVSEDYLADFTKAELTFLHQRVFCPRKRKMVCLTEPEEGRGVEDMPFIGAFVEPEVARAVAMGDLNPMTKLPIVPAPMPESKRRHSQSASRAAAANATAASANPVSANGGRGSGPSMKPIDSYFKGARRIPMGEMDPNCFSVDPQRVAALTHGGLVPRVFPIPRPYLNGSAGGSVPGSPRQMTRASASTSTSPRAPRRRSEPIGTLLARAGGSSTDAARYQTTGMPSNAAAEVDALMSGTSQRPPKKARLCDNKDDGQGQEDVQQQKSKFFPGGGKKKDKEDNHLFSDDSIDEALLSLPDIDGFHEPSKPRKAITVFDESQKTLNKDTRSTSKDDDLTTGTLVDAFAGEENGSPPDGHACDGKPSDNSRSTPSRPSLHRFLYSQESTISPQETPASAESQPPSSIFSSSIKAPSTAASSLAFSSTRSLAASKKTPGLTPLQRMGARAMQRKSPVRGQAGRSPKTAAKKRDKRASLATMPVNPSFVPLPKVDLEEVDALNKPIGSEDCIIPDSDGENENDLDESKLDEEVERGRSCGLNLSRFVYS